LRFANAGLAGSQESVSREPVAMRRKRSQYQAGFGGGVAQIVEKQHTAVRLQVPIDQCADIVVLG
jgi:hypothetical protein